MRAHLIITFLFFFPSGLNAQQILPGDYDFGLTLGYDSVTQKLTGYFQDASGWDEALKRPLFSCVFYLSGRVTGKQFPVVSYYPGDATSDYIQGTLELLNEKTVSLKLDGSHGGCWNVTSFSNEPVRFEIEKERPWLQIRFVVSEKAWFYTEKLRDKRQKSYLVKDDFVCVEKLEGDWVYCTFYGEVTYSGWLMSRDLN